MMTPDPPHLTDEALRAYGFGELDVDSATRVADHLEACAGCRRRLAEVSSDHFLAAHRPAGVSGPLMSSTDGLSVPVVAAGASATPPPASTLPPGLADHPDYEVVRELGRGGMGVVYLAQNRLMGRLEVLKIVSSHLVSRGGVADRFLTEIRNAARLHHPNIVTAYSAVRLGASLILAMEYVEGLDLSKIVEARGPLPIAHACSYAHQAALGLQHAHEHGIVHRDIKPSNLMLARQNNRAMIKVLDFGLAKVQREGRLETGLTHAGQMLGTPHFVAPEQIRDARSADIRADIYSLGCALYYLLTGAPPFEGSSLYDILQAHHSMDAIRLNLKRPDVPVELAALVAKIMSKEPNRRFPLPRDVAQALTPFFMKGGSAFRSAGRELSHPKVSDSFDSVPVVKFRQESTVGSASAPISQQKSASESIPVMGSGGLAASRESAQIEAGRPATRAAGQPLWLWVPAVAAALLLAIWAAWPANLRVKTEVGTIERENLGPRAEVFVENKAEDRPGPAETVGSPPAGRAPVLDSVPAPPPGAIDASDLVAFYDFNDGTATDRSGHGLHGVLSASPPSYVAQGYQGGALRFDPSEENLVKIPVDINPSVMPQITMGGWFNTNSATVTQQLLTHDDGHFDRTLIIGQRGGTHGWKAFKGNGEFGSFPVIVKQWTFVAMRHDHASGTLTLDVDGRRENTKAYFGLGLRWVRIGGRAGPGRKVWFDGDIDNIFIYRRFLGDDQIADIRSRGEAAILPVVDPMGINRARGRPR